MISKKDFVHGLFFISIIFISSLSWASRQVATGTARPSSSDQQEVLDYVPAAQEMRELIKKISPYSFHISEKLRMMIERIESRKDTLVRVHAQHATEYASYEAQWEPYGQQIRLRNITIYLWDGFFSLPKIDLQNPQNPSQTKVLLKQFLHILIAFPDLKIERLADMVQRLALNVVQINLVEQIDREVAQSNHVLIDQCVSAQTPGDCEFYFRQRFFETLDIQQVDLWGAKVPRFPATWVDAIKRADSALAQRIWSNANSVWTGGPSQLYKLPELLKNRDFFRFARSSVSSVWQRVYLFLMSTIAPIGWQQRIQSLCEAQFTGDSHGLYNFLTPAHFNISLPFSVERFQGNHYLNLGHVSMNTGVRQFFINGQPGFECQLSEVNMDFVPSLLDVVSEYATSLTTSSSMKLDDRYKLQFYLRPNLENFDYSSLWTMLENSGTDSELICRFSCYEEVWKTDSDGEDYLAYLVYWMGRENVFYKDHETKNWLEYKGVPFPGNLDLQESFEEISYNTKVKFQSSDRTVSITIFDLEKLVLPANVNIGLSGVSFMYEPIWVGR